MKEPVAKHSKGLEKARNRGSKGYAGKNRKKTMITKPREDYLTLINILRNVIDVFEHRNDPSEVERERIKQETIERGNYQPGLGWTYMDHFVPVVSEDWNRKYGRRREIIRRGTWNSSKRRGEYDRDFAGIWD